MKNVNLVLCLHLHQPPGNFPAVVDQIVRETYRPVLEVIRRHPGVSVNLHVSGVLLEMLAERHADLVTQLRDLAATGRLEMMTGGFYEPVLVEWSEEDRDGQLAMMAAWLKSRLGAEPSGAWLAEGVWGPSLCGSFGRAGILCHRPSGRFADGLPDLSRPGTADSPRLLGRTVRSFAPDCQPGRGHHAHPGGQSRGLAVPARRSGRLPRHALHENRGVLRLDPHADRPRADGQTGPERAGGVAAGNAGRTGGMVAAGLGAPGIFPGAGPSGAAL
ncbi:MAG: hypothetical protein EBS49_08380 [Verrucomicrobia bacterium]|nr:hypothetical protein [Verrucomicrobiota bacterium]